MRFLNILISLCFFGMWIYSLIMNLGIALNILLGVCIPLFLLLDDLVHEPIKLIGWRVVQNDKGKKNG